MTPLLFTLTIKKDKLSDVFMRVNNVNLWFTLLKAWSGVSLSLIFEFQMTERDFWTKYFRAEYLHSLKNAVAAAAEAAEDEDLAIFLKDDDELASKARKKVLSTISLSESWDFLCFSTGMLLLHCLYDHLSTSSAPYVVSFVDRFDELIQLWTWKLT